MSESNTLAVIAGAGKFPVMVIEGAKQHGLRVVVLGLKEIADASLADIADEFYWVAPLRLNEWLKRLHQVGAKQAVMAGYVQKKNMFRRFGILSFLPDRLFLKLWFKDIPDKRNDTVLTAVANLLSQHGVELQDVTRYCPSVLAPSGVLGAERINANLRRDIQFAWGIAKEMGRLDIGQSIAVKNGEIIAVEAIEGTDMMIERAGQLCKNGGWTLLKVAKPNQDMRFDVPTIGINTIENLHKNGAGALIVEADKTVIVDMQDVIALANQYRIVFAAIDHASSISD
ncbi:MAG: UDP-2,3-diacylglucosamine diphosphatase LpxI [Methylococcales bacterium]|nr:UDP-2,3-diacylglucosamine diphosphatase LpxI [Methylococcales bacterium]